jgi:hypothetical protein
VLRAVTDDANEFTIKRTFKMSNLPVGDGSQLSPALFRDDWDPSVPPGNFDAL